MSPHEEIRLLLPTFYVGESRHEQCPFCGGGRSGEKSLRFTRTSEHGGAYQCKRAGCGKEGYVGENYGTHGQRADVRPEFTPRIYSGDITDVPDVIREYYIAKYGFTDRQFTESGCRWSNDYQRTVWQISSPTGAMRGFELRSHRPEDRNKTLQYRHSPDPFAGYYGVHHRPPIIVAVEDVISAYKVSTAGYTAVSLMGSHVSLDLLLDVMKVNETILLCLDRDATDKATKFTQRYAFICPSIRYLPLQKDLKYEDRAQIQKLVEESIS